MAVEDWDVEVDDVLPVKNTTPNPYTQEPIDPDGVTLSQIKMTLTHLPTGKVLKRSDFMSIVTKESLENYALNHMDVIEANLAAQSTKDTPSPFKGAIVFTPPPSTGEKEPGTIVNTAAQLKQRLEEIAPLETELIQRAAALISGKQDAALQAELERIRKQLAELEANAAAAVPVGPLAKG